MNPVRAQALERMSSCQAVGLERGEVEAAISWDGQTLWWGEKTRPAKVRSTVIDYADSEEVVGKLLSAVEDAVENGWYITDKVPDPKTQSGHGAIEDYLDPPAVPESGLEALAFAVNRKNGETLGITVPEPCAGTDLGAVIKHLSDHHASDDVGWQFSGTVTEGSSNFFALMRIWRVNKSSVTVAYSKKADVYEFDRDRLNSIDRESMALFGLAPKPLKVGEGKIKPVTFF